MSLKSWKKEFYPIPASKCSKKGALAHSLQKWKGLRSSNLKRHGLTRDTFGDIYFNDFSQEFVVNDETCALCHRYMNDYDCSACPLSIARGDHSCDEPENLDVHSPFWIYREDGNPEPMIRLLAKVLKRAEKKR